MTISDRRFPSARAIGALLALTASPVAADIALDQSCRVLAVIGGNQADAVPALLTDIAARWPDQNRAAATQQISGLMQSGQFAGGNVYQLSRMGDDLADHIVVLRIATGETLGMRLTYEWVPDGMALTRLDIKLDYASEFGIQLPPNAQPETCP